MPYGLIFLFVARFFIYLLKEDEKTVEEYCDNGIQYLVNKKTIKMPHIYHSRQILRIQDNKALSEKDIKHAYYKIYNDLGELRERIPASIDIAELRAAKFYLLDRWAYLAHIN